ESGIAELPKTGKFVELGMINSIRPGGTYVSGWHAQVLKKDGVIGSAAQISNRHIRLSLCRRQATGIPNSFRRRLRVLCARLIGFSPFVVQHSTLRSRHDLSNVAQ